MRHDDPMFPFERTRAVARLLALLAAAALLVGVSALRHPRATLDPWRPGPASLIERPLGHPPAPPVDSAPRQAWVLPSGRQ
ncbi:MAG: hypothetical protein EHM78_22300 [Myxococcaceae bacterium]|nr:MAG: hypothetical protein EHM78_22300 [Myxococcaceae bacterium]